MASEHRFGFEWDLYSHLNPQYELQFKNWVSPLTPADFKDKTVLDAGCGMGRNSYWALKWGAGRLVAFDYDERTVAVARHNLKEFPTTEVLFKSIYDIDWNNEFDIAFSIGVIHHLENPQAALANMVRALKPGGTLLIWVYSYEGNAWVPRFIDPIRKALTSKLPVRMVYWLSYGASVPLWLMLKLFGGSTPYLKELSKFKFWHIHGIVFDQLIPIIAHYWKKSEVADMINQLPVRDIRIHQPPNKSGWTVLAIKK